MFGAGPPSAPAARPLLRTLPGRLFILTSILLLGLLAVRLVATLPEIVELFRKVARLGWFVSVVWLAWLALASRGRRFLWRVRRKLILSYVFLGFVPVLLVMALALIGGLILYLSVAAYMFHEGIADFGDGVAQVADTVAANLDADEAGQVALLARQYAGAAGRFPGLSLAVLPAGGGRAVAAGPWSHAPPPAGLPDWLRAQQSPFRGAIALRADAASDTWLLVLRIVRPTAEGARVVVVDLPLDASMARAIEAETRTRIGRLSVPELCGGTGVPASGNATGGMFALFRQTVAFMPCTHWETGGTGRVSISLDAPLGRLYARVSEVAQFDPASDLFVVLLAVLAVLFLVIQGSALVMGALLARSITYAVHELFVGTERVQRGDFGHRIRIESDDQLGELATSFNSMSAGIEHLLHVQREKQRLDDELRIAREIQKSLLPTAVPVIDGVSIADLCEPAREVGGDYYDFFDLGHRRLGVMIADVSGKGTSAALYMAELKGLMLALAGRETSPRRLLIEVNRLLAGHLDNRSFITMTYAVFDFDARTVTCARAGHTPLIVVSGGQSEVVIPSGMVLGLRLPGAEARFAEVLEEYTRPLCDGDAVLLYTDGLSEATSPEGDLYSDDGLARVVAAQHQLDATGIRERIVREVRAFVGQAEPHDDLTMVVVKMAGPGAAA